MGCGIRVDPSFGDPSFGCPIRFQGYNQQVMTAVSLFDVLSTVGRETCAGEVTAQLAAQLVEASLVDWQRIQQYESDFSPTKTDDLNLVLEIDRSIYAMYSQWLAEAEAVYARGNQLIACGHMVPKIDELNDALGNAHARLLATPEKLVHAIEQVKRGEAIPSKELRDELNARLRARC